MGVQSQAATCSIYSQGTMYVTNKLVCTVVQFMQNIYFFQQPQMHETP